MRRCTGRWTRLLKRQEGGYACLHGRTYTHVRTYGHQPRSHGLCVPLQKLVDNFLLCSIASSACPLLLLLLVLCCLYMHVCVLLRDETMCSCRVKGTLAPACPLPSTPLPVSARCPPTDCSVCGIHNRNLFAAIRGESPHAAVGFCCRRRCRITDFFHGHFYETNE